MMPQSNLRGLVGSVQSIIKGRPLHPMSETGIMRNVNVTSEDSQKISMRPRRDIQFNAWVFNIHVDMS